MPLPNEFSAATSKTSGSFSEMEGVSFNGTLAEGRTGQSPHKNWLLLAFAKRVADGDAKPHETAFMTALMAADIPSQELAAEMRDVANTIAFIDSIDNMQNEMLIDAAVRMDGGE